MSWDCTGKIQSFSVLSDFRSDLILSLSGASFMSLSFSLEAVTYLQLVTNFKGLEISCVSKGANCFFED